jgi:Transposase IS66 family
MRARASISTSPRPLGRRIGGGARADHPVDRRPPPAGAMAFDLARLANAPIAAEAVRRIDELFEIDRAISGRSRDERLAVRGEQSRPLVIAFEAWLRHQRSLLSRTSETAKAIVYSLKRWASFMRSSTTAGSASPTTPPEPALRGVAIGRANWTFAGSDAGGQRAAAVYTSSRRARSTTSIPRLGSRAFWPSCQTLRSGSAGSFPGTGRQVARRSRRLSPRLDPTEAADHTCVTHRMDIHSSPTAGTLSPRRSCRPRWVLADTSVGRFRRPPSAEPSPASDRDGEACAHRAQLRG